MSTDYLSPIALYTQPNKGGFLGILPDGPDDNIYYLSSTNFPQVFEMQTDFVKVPEPSTFVFAVTLLFVFLLFKSNKLILSNSKRE